MHGIKLSLLALAICLAISLFDGVDAAKTNTAVGSQTTKKEANPSAGNKKSRRKPKSNTAVGSLPTKKGANPAVPGTNPHANGSSKAARRAEKHAAKKTVTVLPKDLQHILDHLVDEIKLGKDPMAHVNFHDFPGKLHVHKHTADPHGIEEHYLKVIFMRLEVARFAHTLTTHKDKKGELEKELADFKKNNKIYTNLGEEKPTKEVSEKDANSMVVHLIKSKVMALMHKEKGFFSHQDKLTKEEIVKASADIASAMKMAKIKHDVTTLTKEYKEYQNHHGKNKDKHHHVEDNGNEKLPIKDKKLEKNLSIKIPKLGGSNSGSLSQSPTGRGGKLHDLGSPKDHSGTLNNAEKLVVHHNPPTHKPEVIGGESPSLSPSRHQGSEGLISDLPVSGGYSGTHGSNSHGNDDYAEESVSNGGVGNVGGSESGAFEQTSGTSSVDNGNDFGESVSTGGHGHIGGQTPESYVQDAGESSFANGDALSKQISTGQSEPPTQEEDDKETKQEESKFVDTPPAVSQKGYTGTESASEEFDRNTLTSTNEKEGTEDNLVERNESPSGTGTGGVEGDMNENKVDRSVVDADSAVGGITERELASNTGDGDGEIESKLPEENDEDKENELSKVKGPKKPDADADD